MDLGEKAPGPGGAANQFLTKFDNKGTAYGTPARHPLPVPRQGAGARGAG